MNLEICKRCLFNVNLSVLLHCNAGGYTDDPRCFLFDVHLCSKETVGTKYYCSVLGGVYIDKKFLGKRFYLNDNVESFVLANGMYGEFFNLLNASSVRQLTGVTLDCFYSLEHNLYDWNVEKWI